MKIREKSIRVLIVENEEAFLFGLKKLLENTKTIIDTARSLAEAEKLLRQNIYQAVLTDLRLSTPGVIEGYDVVKMARELHPKCKIMVLTAFAEDTEKYHDAEGADIFLEKPVAPDRIRQFLDSL